MEKCGGQAGRVPITGILGDQEGSRKVKLEGEELTEEELSHVSIKLENEWQASSNEEEALDESFTVAKVDVDPLLLAPAEDPGDQGQRSSCSCQKEIESLKCTVKQLTLQMEQQNKMIKKQSQVITGIKSSIRNAALSLLTCGKDEEKDVEDGNGVDEFPGNEKIGRPTAVTPQLLSNPEVTAGHQRSETQTQDNFQDGKDCSPVTIVSCTGNYSGGVQITASVPFLASPTSSQLGSSVGQRTNDEKIVDMEDINLEDDDDKDSSYIPDDESEEDADQEMEDEKSYHGASSSGAKSVKPKGDFSCWKCSKSFSWKKCLDRHMRRTHSNTISTFKCHLCTKVFKEGSGLKKHIQSAHEGIRYKCTHCPGTFSQIFDVRRHENSVHPEGVGLPPKQECKICGIHLLSLNSLHRHISRMHKESESLQTFVQRLPQRRPPVSFK